MNLEERRNCLAIPCGCLEFYLPFICVMILLDDGTKRSWQSTTDEVVPTNRTLGCDTIVTITGNKGSWWDGIFREWLAYII